MNKIILEGFAPDREKVLRSLKCPPEGELRERLLSEIGRLESEVKARPEIFYEFADDFDKEGSGAVYVLITLGGRISDYSREMFDKGECLSGLVADTWADEALFGADKKAAEILREECAVRNKGILKRIDPPAGAPIEYNKKILDAIGECPVRITEAYMYDPPKTMSYILTLTDDVNIFKAQHDCSKCPNLNCPRRSVNAEKMESVSAHEKVYGTEKIDALCIDIGTTTIAFEKIGGSKQSLTMVNRQRRFGADVISRIEAANRGHGRELQSIIQFQIAEGMNALYKNSELPKQVIVSANTTMIQLLMGFSCEKMGSYPFEPENKGYIETVFKYRGSQIPMKIIPAVSAFVGGDIVSGMYMCDFDLSDKVNLFIDLGTNGEMAIGSTERIITASTAAGPAFEGGRISCGTGSVDGAMCSIDLNSQEIKTINNMPPSGICGTGIVELISEMLREGIIDKSGLLEDKYFSSGYPFAGGLTFTQRDIREIQTAKAAVRAGIEMLIKNYGCEYEDINKVYIAGGFGYRLDVKSACSIGLIPMELQNKCSAVGNSSLGGAVKFAAHPEDRDRLENICAVCEELPLALDDEFNKTYIECMNF